MALLKAFVCQVFLFGLYKLVLEQVIEKHFVPDELTRNCLFGFICLLCFGIQIYTDKVEEQNFHAERSRTQGRRRSSPDRDESVSEYLDLRKVHMMRTLDAAMANMGQMPMTEGYVKNVIFATAGPEDASFVPQPDVIVLEEIHVTKLGDSVIPNEMHAPFYEDSKTEPVSMSRRVEEVEEDAEVEEDESETKSDVCEEEEDIVTVIDTSKQNPTVKRVENSKTESEEEEEEEEEVEEKKTSPVLDNNKMEEKREKESSEEESEEEEEEEKEVEEEKKTPVVDKKNEKTVEKREKEPSKAESEEEEDEEEEDSEGEENERKLNVKKVTKNS